MDQDTKDAFDRIIRALADIRERLNYSVVGTTASIMKTNIDDLKKRFDDIEEKLP